MSKRKPYNPDSKCSKCGHDDIATTYCPGCVPRCRRHPFEDGEHLDRYCRKCGFAWAEDCIADTSDTLLPQEQFAKVRLAERERCAKICESFIEKYSNIYVDHRNQDRRFIAFQCAEAIRN